MPRTSLPVYFLCLLTLSLAAYLQNGLHGEKRSVRDAEAKECIKCGSAMKGHCLGPNMCCANEFGCLYNTKETHPCQNVTYMPAPCEAGRKSCGEGGRCVADSTCCNKVGCTGDQVCKL